MIFKEGHIFYFRPYIYEDGGIPTYKFCIILKALSNDIVTITLPTSQDHIPDNILKHGCIDVPEKQIHAYVFAKDKQIAYNEKESKEFRFSKNTFIYSKLIKQCSVLEWENQISTNQTKVDYIATLNSDEFKALIDCIKNSPSISRKYRKIL